MGEESEWEERVDGILKGCKDKSTSAKDDVFQEYLKNNLDLPCEAVGTEDDEEYLLYDIEGSGDDLCGILGKVKFKSDKRRRLLVPLAELRVVDKESGNHRLIDDYSYWFCNSR